VIQGGEDAEDALSCLSPSAKELLIIGPFGGKHPVKIRQGMCLRHPVYIWSCMKHICVYHVYTYMYKYIHVCLHTRTNIYTWVGVRVCICIYTHCICICMYSRWERLVNSS